MSVLTLSPVAPEPPSPMVTSVTPTLDPDTSTSPGVVGLEQDLHPQDGGAFPGPSTLSMGGVPLGRDSAHRSKKPPPLHTGADWKVVLHLPEIETWLRATSDRVTQLTHSAGQDSENRHVDVHLVQLKDICEDISDHVEQIHALLETEFSLKLLSYSVNIIVDIRTVQLLWHQLRVSVLVLKERLLQGLQDSNGNFTRQTDILQAFSQDQHETRLDALTEVDDCGQLTIRCSQDYFSLDCGITAFELSDYSPGDEPDGPGQASQDDPQGVDRDLGLDPETEPEPEESEESGLPDQKVNNSLPDLNPPPQDPSSAMSNHCEGGKRPLQGGSHSTAVASPTQPSLPKRAAFFSEGGARPDEPGGAVRSSNPPSGPQTQAELSSSSSPSLTDPTDPNKFWLELDLVYPDNVSQSFGCLQVMTSSSGGSEASEPRPQEDWRTLSAAVLTTNTSPSSRQQMHSECDSDSSLPSPVRQQAPSSDVEASGEESDPRPPANKKKAWTVKCQEKKVSPRTSQDREHWFGSEEFLALPDQLRKTEMLALNLESLAQSIPLRPGGGVGDVDASQEALQDVDDWDLTEFNTDWEVGDSGEDSPSSPLPPPLPHRRKPLGRFSPSSSSDIAPSLDDSLESGPLSDLQSEDEDRRSADRLQFTAPPLDRKGGASLVQRLLEDIECQDKDPDIWRKIESFVQQLDGFILWLQEALDATENWTQPRQDLDSLRTYLDTHLSFKLNVDSHLTLKENIVEDGRALLATIPSHQTGLKEILHMVSSQWDQLQRQIRRQHGWMLRALRCIQVRLLYTVQSQEPGGSDKQAARCPGDGLKANPISSKHESQQAALEQMAIQLGSLQYQPAAGGRQCRQLAVSNSLQEMEADYQELWDWLMDMDAMVTDSHQLMMSEEQRHQLFKSSRAELQLMEGRRNNLMRRAEALKRNNMELHGTFQHKIHTLTHTWTQLERILSSHSGPSPPGRPSSFSSTLSSDGGPQSASSAEERRGILSPLTTSLLEQLEARIKELKAWLRDTELLIFNACLRRDRDATAQLPLFKALCSDVRARRRGVSSVLKLCQKLLQQSQAGPLAEVGPEAEQQREALQLLSINLERRWDAIVMQALQWQNRLKKELGETQVPGNFLDPGLVDLHQPSPPPARAPVPLPDDSWEWDETDMTIAEPLEEPDLTQNLPTETEPQPGGIQTSWVGGASCVTSQPFPPGAQVWQVYSLHSVDLFPHNPNISTKVGKPNLLLKSLSKDSTFSSMESLPDLLGGVMASGRGGGSRGNEEEGGRQEWSRGSSRRSESESGIVSDTGDTEGMFQDEQGSRTEERKKGRGWRVDGSREEEKKKSNRKKGGEEVLPNVIISDPDLENIASPKSRRDSVLSQGSSLESVLAFGVDLYPSKEVLHRRASLESGLAPCADAQEGQTGGSVGGIAPLEPTKESEAPQGDIESEELSRRTLDLLRRLENIQSPAAAKMTRSVSDLTLRSRSQQRRRLPASPSLGGRRLIGQPSLVNESSAAASLTELSSTEDSSLGSEDFTGLRNQRPPLPDPTSAKRRCCHRNGPRGQVVEEADATSLSLVVNVSCTSACTDEDEDDSDLLSSSTLTLTEEELGVRDGEDEEELTGVSSGNENEQDDEEAMEESYALGLDYTKLQSWIRPPRTSSTSKTEAGLWDELRCGANLPAQHEEMSPRGRPATTSDDNKNEEVEEENRRNAARNYISQFADDVENGNVDEDDELLREESSVFTKKGESLRETFVFPQTREEDNTSIKEPSTSTPCHLSPLPRTSSLVGQLQGEIPCHSPSLPSPPSLSPVEDIRPAPVGTRKSITIQEKFKFSSFVTEETKLKVRDKDTSPPPRKWCGPQPSCCAQLPRPAKAHMQKDGKENVHNFILEIIDMTSMALKSKEAEEAEGCGRPAETASMAEIREKVLRHAHQPLPLRKGDFYSYLSLSSHDSDCGELVQDPDDRRSPLPSPDIRDEETLFSACTEEVYLGPPLCYSMAPPGAATARSCDSPQEEPANARGSPSSTFCDVAVLRQRNEGPAYLNPPSIDSAAATTAADTKAPGSNMVAVMTKISVCGAATNPSKEPPAAGACINPEINGVAIRGGDRGEPEVERQGARGPRGHTLSQQEVKTSRQLAPPQATRAALRPASSRTGPSASMMGPSVQRTAIVAGPARLQL